MAWGTPFACAMVGTKIVFPGPHLQPRDLAELIQAEKVTFAAGVPTIWFGLLALLDKERYDLSSLRATVVGACAKAGITVSVVGLGTDGVAGSNNDLDMLEAMDFAGKLAKVSALDPTVLPAADLLEDLVAHFRQRTHVEETPL